MYYLRRSKKKRTTGCLRVKQGKRKLCVCEDEKSTEGEKTIFEGIKIVVTTFLLLCSI